MAELCHLEGLLANGAGNKNGGYSLSGRVALKNKNCHLIEQVTAFLRKQRGSFGYLSIIVQQRRLLCHIAGVSMQEVGFARGH